jgi:hypothetical protein
MNTFILRFDTPIKRIGILVASVGFAAMIFGFVEIALDTRHYFSEYFSAVFRKSHYATSAYWKAAWGTYLLIIGFMLSIYYDKGIGRVIMWVRYGTPESEEITKNVKEDAALTTGDKISIILIAGAIAFMLFR